MAEREQFTADELQRASALAQEINQFHGDATAAQNSAFFVLHLSVTCAPTQAHWAKLERQGYFMRGVPWARYLDRLVDEGFLTLVGEEYQPTALAWVALGPLGAQNKLKYYLEHPLVGVSDPLLIAGGDF